MADPLIAVPELAALPASERPVLLDVRWQLGGPPGYAEYLDGHIPGASYVDLATDLADPPGDRGRHPLPAPARFVDAMRRCGVRNDRPVLAYDAGTSTAAARLWWLLRHFGHADVRVLDGGYAAWVEADGAVEHGNAAPVAGDFFGTPGHMPVLDAAGAERVAREGLLIDARAPERFRGEAEPVDPVAGHIPGAVNMPASRNVIGSESPQGGLFNVPDDLEVFYAGVGVRREGEVGVYCGSGVSAAHNVLALAVVGKEAALYPGSWSEWISDPRRPVEIGPTSFL